MSAFLRKEVRGQKKSGGTGVRFCGGKSCNATRMRRRILQGKGRTGGAFCTREGQNGRRVLQGKTRDGRRVMREAADKTVLFFPKMPFLYKNKKIVEERFPYLDQKLCKIYKI